MEPTDFTDRLNERATLEAELTTPYRPVQVMERIAASIIRESLAEHTERRVTASHVECYCGEILLVNFGATITHRQHQADAAAAALAEFTARESVTA